LATTLDSGPTEPTEGETEPEAHDHSGESKVWCETCQHTHIASIPEVTYACHSCGFGSWHSEIATEHESLCPGHETYPLSHIMRPDRPSALAAHPVQDEGQEREARQEAKRRYPTYYKGLVGEREIETWDVFIAGAEWRAAHLVQDEGADAEFIAAARHAADVEEIARVLAGHVMVQRSNTSRRGFTDHRRECGACAFALPWEAWFTELIAHQSAVIVAYFAGGVR
jgi:hypothetical protein